MVGLERWVAAWPELRSNDIRNFALSIVARIQVHADRIDIMLNPVYPNRNLRHASTRVRRVLSLKSTSLARNLAAISETSVPLKSDRETKASLRRAFAD